MPLPRKNLWADSPYLSVLYHTDDIGSLAQEVLHFILVDADLIVDFCLL